MIKKLRINIDRHCLYLFDNDSSKPYAEQGIISVNTACLEDVISYLHYTQPTKNERNIHEALQNAIKIIKNDIKLCENGKNSMSDVYINEIIFISNGIANKGIINTHQLISNVLQQTYCNAIDKNKIYINSFSICGDQGQNKLINHS